MEQHIDITGLSHVGAGVGRLDGKVVFVDGALPEEKVRVTLGESKKGITSATLEEVIVPSPGRIAPQCPAAGVCGGCALIHASDALEDNLKTQQVEDAMRRLGKLDVEVRPTLAAQKRYHYRNKGIFHVAYENGCARLGFFEKGSHNLVPASHCQLFSDKVCALARYLEEGITHSGIAHAIDKVMIRESHYSGEMMVVFVGTSQKFRHAALLETMVRDHSEVVSVWQNICTNPRLMLGRAYNHLYGQKTIPEALGDVRYDLSPASFFQINTEETNVLYGTAKEMLGDITGKAILDLYCGMGTIGMFVASRDQDLTGVESVGAAISDAKEAAKKAGFEKAHFYTAKAEEWLPKYLAKGGKVDIAIIDPPRKGCDPKLLDALITAQVPKILSISCNPATHARDLAILSKHYTLSPVQPVNLFPKTSHIESICVLEWKE